MADASGMASLSHLPLFTGMPDIAVSHAIQWSVDLDRLLRSSKPVTRFYAQLEYTVWGIALGAHCEAILKCGPQMLWWSQEPISSATTASLYKLDPGQDKTFANALVQRLAEAFRTGNNLTRFCVLKVFLLASKGPRLKNRCNMGLFKKERIANYPEVLRRVKAVLDSGDAIARALALRLIGCLADLAVDSVDVHRLVFEALQSPHHKEVEAALYAMGCLCELSVEFAQCALEKLVDMAYTMQTPPDIKLAAIRVFSKLGLSPSLSVKAQKAGKDLLLWMPTTEIVSVMLVSLTRLALESFVTIQPQVEVLMAYLSSDPRATLRAVALQCLSRLALRASRSNAFVGDEFHVILSVIEDVAAPPALHVLTFQLLKKLSAHFVMTVDTRDLQRLLSFLELSTFHRDWSVTQAALDCSVEFACNLTRLTRSRYEGQGEESRKDFQSAANASSNETQTEVDFATRVALLLCDQLAFVGARGKENHKEELAKIQEASEERRFERLCSLHEFIVRLVRGCPQISSIMIDSVSGIIERSTSEQLKDSLQPIDKQQSVTEISQLEVDNEARTKSILEGAAAPVVDTACRDLQLLESRLEFILALCHCLCVCVRDLEVNIACIVFPKLLDLSTMIQELDPSCEILRAILPALLKARMVNQQRDISAEKSVKRLILRTIVQMRRSGDFWAAYKVGVEAAGYGLWAAAYPTFELLAKKAQSEGCYLWLVSLSQLAKAEGILANVTANEESLLDRMRSRETDSDLRCVMSGGLGPVGMDLDGPFRSTDEHTEEKGEEKEVDCLMFGEAAARAIPLLRGAGNSLAAGVCSERTFEFQRWLISLRLRLVQTVAEFVRVVDFLSLDVGASDEEASRYNRREGNHINMQNPVLDIGSASGFDGGVTGDEVYQRQFVSSYKSAGEKSFALGTQLMHQAKELDLLSISFMGLDLESSQSLSRTALSCSLLAFCSHAVFSISPLGRENHSFGIKPSAQDLYNRLRQFKGFESTELSSLCVGEKPDMEIFGTASFGSATTSLASICKRTLENVFQLRKEGAAMVQSGQLQAVCGRGVNILHVVVSEWFQSQSPIPKFFFCTRPRTSVELFVAQTGGEEPNELSVNQGSALPLSLCAQVTNLPQGSSLKLKTLSCLLSFEVVENTSLLEEDLYAGWKLGWHEGQASNSSLNSFSLLGKLVLRAKLEGSPDSVKLEQDLVSMQKDINGEVSFQDGEGQGLSTGGAFGRSFVSVAMDGKGYGFASCVLDVTSLQCGIYQLSLHSVGTDTGNRPWVLLTSSVRHTFRITPAS